MVANWPRKDEMMEAYQKESTIVLYALKVFPRFSELSYA